MTRLFLPVLFLLLSAAPPALAQELSLETERVVVFKDGTALVVRRGVGTPDADGVVWTEEVPDSAALGCFWAAVDGGDAPGGPRIAAMRAEHVERVETDDEEVLVRSTRELLEANVGRDVRLQLVPPSSELVSGTILEVLGDAGLCVLRTADGPALAVAIADVRSVRAEDLATRRAPDPRAVRAKRLSIELAQGDGPLAGGEVALRLVYFTPGLRWIPTYRLEGDLESRGSLSLTAEIVNELLDLEGTEVDLVVGVPSFRFGREVSPLSLESAMRDALSRAGLTLQPLSNALFTQRALDPGSLPSGPSPAPGAAPGAAVAPELAATGEQDLYVYHAGRIDLPKGARASLPLWTETVPVEHVYTCDVAIARGSEWGAFRRDQEAGEGSPLALSSTPVWHQLRLVNHGAHPWTTGPALLLRGFLPLGQDLLTYTPPGAETLLPMTVAVDVRGSFEEEQIERREQALQRDGRSYDLIVKRLTIRVENHRDEPARTRVRVGLGGDVTATSEGGRVVHGEPRSSDWAPANRFDHALNPHSDVEFEVELAPGETREMTLDVRLYAR